MTAPTKQEPARTAVLVSGDGTEAEVAARYADAIPDWASWPEADRQETVRLTRQIWRQQEGLSAKVSLEDGAAEIRLEPENNPTLALLRQSATFGTGSEALADYTLTAMAHRLNAEGNLGTQSLTAALAFIAGGKPTDPIQAMLLVQMWSVHEAAQKALRMANGAEYVEHASALGNLSVKLVNAFSRQAEVLAKLQRGGEQTVRHVYVDARTQTAFNCPPHQAKDEIQSHEQNGGGAFGPAMLGYDPPWDGLPMPSDQGSKPLSASRRKGGSSER